MKKLTKKQWLWEFSKKIVVTVAILFVAVIIFTAVEIHRAISVGAEMPDTMITVMADVFKWTVVSYAVKAGFENVIKIRKGDDYDGMDSQ